MQASHFTFINKTKLYKDSWVQGTMKMSGCRLHFCFQRTNAHFHRTRGRSSRNKHHDFPSTQAKYKPKLRFPPN
uniref:Uncharacterized protein n=1 Tax=Arundo donax TaxID=35708 RepID=A0A0A8YFH2_ARUDO